MLDEPAIDGETTLDGGPPWGTSWGLPRSDWAIRRGDRATLESESADVVRYTTSEVAGGREVSCFATWTFWDGVLASIVVRPRDGQSELGALLVAFGLDQEALRDEGDGLVTGVVGQTRVDVDRLDGYISMREVAT